MPKTRWEKHKDRIVELGLTYELYRDKLSRNWRLRLRTRGYPTVHRTTGTPDKDKAIVIARKHIKDIAGGHNQKNLVIDELLTMWLERGGRRGYMEKATRDANRSRITNILQWHEQQGITRFRELSFDTGSRYKSFLMERYPSKHTVNRHLEVLKAATRWAYEDARYVTSDPLNSVRLLRIKPEDRKRVRDYTPNELRRILKAAKLKLPLPLYVAVLLCLYAGLRRTDACGLRVGDVQQRESHTYLIVSRSKSKNKREIPLKPGIAEMIVALVGNRLGSDPLLIWPEKTPMSPRTLSHKVSLLIRGLGIHDVRNPLHALRHTFISLLLVKHGIPARVVQELAGHKHLATTVGYAHVHDRDKEHAISRL